MPRFKKPFPCVICGGKGKTLEFGTEKRCDHCKGSGLAVPPKASNAKT